MPKNTDDTDRDLAICRFSSFIQECTSQSKKVTYLGIEFNSQLMTIALSPQKLELVSSELQFVHGRTRATIKQMQRDWGILSHASKVIKGGRTFSRSMLNLLKGLEPTKKRVWLSKAFLMDLSLWESVSLVFNGKEIIIPQNDGRGLSFITDSSKKGYKFIYRDTWRAGFFNSALLPGGHEFLDPSHEHWLNVDVHLEDPSINILEMIPVWLCIHVHESEWWSCGVFL